jgi:hypothetical protein
MKSKAQKYVNTLRKVKPESPKFIMAGDRFVTCYVSSNGSLIWGDCKELTPERVLALRDWLTDTFDIPPVKGRKPGWSRED